MAARVCLVALAAALLLAVPGQSADADACKAAANPTALISQLGACAAGPTPSCCSAAKSLSQTGALAGCLCVPGLVDQLVSGAATYGISGAQVTGVLKSCGVPYSGSGC